MDKIEIQILDNNNGIIGVLEVEQNSKAPFNLSVGISDLKNINDRSGSFSTSFKVAATKDNDILLNHIYNSSEKNYKDFDEDKPCRVLINGFPIEKGLLRIDRISTGGSGNFRDYSFQFYGNNMEWVLAMQDKYFNDLTYTDKLFKYDSSTCENSWINTSGNNDAVFSYINRGYNILPNTKSVGDLYPDYFTYDVVKDAFKLIGWNLESSFIEQQHFKELITPFFGNNFRLTEQQTAQEEAFVRLQDEVVNLDTSFSSTGGFIDSLFLLDNSYSTINVLPWIGGTNVSSFDETNPYYDNGDNWDSFFGYLNNTTHVYTAPINGYYSVYLDSSCTLEANNNYNNTLLTYYLYKRVGTNSPTNIGAMSTTSSSVNTYTNGSYNVKSINSEREKLSVYLNQGERIFVGGRVGYSGFDTGTTGLRIKHHNNTTIKVVQEDALLEGNYFNWKEVSDNQYPLLKYITDLGKLFNWYFRTNNATKTVYIETRDDFYKPLNKSVDFTDKIDNKKQYELNFNSKFYTQLHKFTYKEDGDDEFVDWFNDRFNQNYQELVHEYPEKFKSGTTTLSTEIISPTISVRDNYDLSLGLSPISSFMWNDAPDADNRNPEKRTNWQPRLLYYKYGTQTYVDGTLREWNWNSEATNRTLIPYCLSFNKVVGNKTLTDVAGNLDFKDLISYNYDTGILDTSVSENGLVSNYYEKTLREILEGRTLSINLFLDLDDYKNLDFRKAIYFDNRYSDIEGYWRIQKISNFNPIGKGSTKVELIKAKNFIPLKYTNKNTDFFTDIDEELASFRTGNVVNNSRGKTNNNEQILGYNNEVNPRSTVVGSNLVSSSDNVRMGIYNLDVSTDTFQLGTGSQNGEYSLIRVDEDGNVYFNGKLIYGVDFASTIVKRENLDFTLDRETLTYICDTSANDITISLNGSYVVGDYWNIKKIDSKNLIDFDMSPSFEIDYSTTSPKIKIKNTSMTLQYIGDNKFIII